MSLPIPLDLLDPDPSDSLPCECSFPGRSGGVGASEYRYGVRTHGIPTMKAQLDASDGMALQIADRSTVTTGSAHRTTVALSRKLYVVEP